MAAVKTVVFDIYNTLLDNETDEEREETYGFLSLWLSYHGVKITPPDLRRLYLETCNNEIGKSGEPYPDIDIGKVFWQLIAGAGGDVPPPAAMVSEMALLFRMLTTNRLSPFPGVIGMLDRLKGKAKLGIASNAQRLFTIPELGKFGLMGYFDAIVFSSEIGVCKPDRKIFAAALAALSARPETAVYVGDNPIADIYGAHNAGMKTVWINRAGKVEETGGAKPDFEVRDEAALTDLLLSLIEGHP